MPRGVPRSPAFNNHSHNLLHNRYDYAPPALFPDIDVSEETRIKWTHQTKNLHPRQRSPYNDPIVVMLVLDTIISTEPMTMIRSKRITPVLNVNYPRIDWKTQNVGRIINEITETVASCPGITALSTPLRLGRDWAGLHWTYDPNLAALAALYQMREYIGTLAILESHDVNYKRPKSVWETLKWSDNPVR